MSAERPGVTLAQVRDTPLSVDEVLEAVRHPRAGGVAVFIGFVREHDHDRDVRGLDYSSHPEASRTLEQVAQRVVDREDVIAAAVVHRTGSLVVGDLAVVAAVSAAHRGPAFEACRELVDTLKVTVPIWKHQMFADGSDEWVGMP